MPDSDSDRPPPEPAPTPRYCFRHRRWAPHGCLLVSGAECQAGPHEEDGPIDAFAEHD